MPFISDIENAAEWIMISSSLSNGVMGLNRAKLKAWIDVFAIMSKFGGSEGGFAVCSDVIGKYCVYSDPSSLNHHHCVVILYLHRNSKS